MRQRRQVRVFQRILLLFALAFTAPGAVRAQAQETSLRLRGTVVDGLTGKPIARALVRSPDMTFATLTDGQGRFVVDLRKSSAGGAKAQSQSSGDSAGILSIGARRPGYLSGQDFLSFPLDERIATRDLTIKLMPGAKISGHISAGDAESVANVQVVLLERQADLRGRTTWTHCGETKSNLQGDFHFSGLLPGQYTLLTREWRGDPPGPEQFVEPEQRYPGAFLGDAASLAASSRLDLRYGEAKKADLHLQSRTFYAVTLPVLFVLSKGYFDVSGGFNVSDADNPFAMVKLAYNDRRHELQGMLPDGQHTFTIAGVSGKDEQGFGQVSVHVAGAPARTAPVALVRGSEIAVKVRKQFSRTRPILRAGAEGVDPPAREFPDQPMVAVMLLGEDGYTQTPFATGIDDSSVPDVQPGRYWVEAEAAGSYVASIRSGGLDLSREPLEVVSGKATQPIEIILRDDCPDLQGTVVHGTEPLASPSRVFLLPLDGTGHFQQTLVEPAGTFSFPTPAPGTYRIVAVSGALSSVPYLETDFLKRFEGKGMTVTIVPGQPAHVDVPLMDLDSPEQR